MAQPSRVLGVLAGRDLLPGALEAWLGWAERVVAADGGADLCRAAGREPDAIVGGPGFHRRRDQADPRRDQDSSDADKLLAFLAREGHRSITLIGVEGDRLDHVLATLYACARSDVEEIRLILRTGIGIVQKTRSARFWACTGRVSLLPLGVCRVTFQGVQWPLLDRVLDPLGLVSLSNEVVEKASEGMPSGIELTIHEGAAVLFLSDDPLRVASARSEAGQPLCDGTP